jgi:hypothetical protein
VYLTPQRRPTLAEAEVAYLAKFGQGAPVWSALGRMDLAEVLLEAVERGIPWTAESLGERLGVPPSPPGADE